MTAAVIVDDSGRVLVARRGPGQRMSGFWEFPGGKIEGDEQPERCLARELAEELGLEAAVGAHVATVVHAYDWGTIELLAFWTRILGGTITLSDHDAVRWVTPRQLLRRKLAPADVPIAREVVAQLER